jgi:enamine deaminase RidA (YjgF/YER057c/UK114 family)
MLMVREAYQPRPREGGQTILRRMADIEILNPDGLAAPRGTYSHVARVPSGATLVAIAGQVAIGPDGELVGPGDFDAQCAQVYENVAAALRGAVAGWDNVIQSMTFLTRREDVPRFRAWRERAFADMFPTGVYPPNTLLVVSGLASPDLLLEVQVIAAI